MREQQFINRYESEWQALEDYIIYKKANSVQRKKLPDPAMTDKDFPINYRRVCNQLALAQTRHFSEHLVARINQIVIDSHHLLYKRRGNLSQLLQFIFVDFPVAVRREKVVMLWALVFFLLPAIFAFVLIQFVPITAYSFVDADTLRDIERMYDVKLSRDAGEDIQMFGWYIYNNIGIALRSFSSGLILGVGAIVTSVFNGMHIGAIFSHLQNMGYASKNLYPFVITHGAFELTAIVISSGAGLRLGLSFLFPKRDTRVQSIAKTTQSLVPIIIGFTVMLFIAAMIEAFWSASDLPNTVKYTVGTICWLSVITYFIFAGRSNEPR